MRGTHLNPVEGDWCWLLKTPCTMLNGIVTRHEWLRCDYEGSHQASCDGTGACMIVIGYLYAEFAAQVAPVCVLLLVRRAAYQ